MFKNMRLGILFDILLNPSFKMTTSFTNIARSKLNLYTRKNFQSLAVWSLCKKEFLICKELGTTVMLKLS